MKKIALFLLVSAMTIATLASCGSDSEGTTTAAKSSNTPVNSSATTTSDKPATTTSSKPATTTNGTPDTTTASTPATTTVSTPATTTGNDQPDTPAKASITGWADNNEEDGNVYYEITANSDGTVKVDYTKEDYDYAANRYGYAGFSWVNMKVDISDVYTGQSKLVLKIKGESGKSLLIKPFDDQAYEKTMNFDGTEQELTIDLNNVKADANKVIIMFGDGGATDSTGTFTILEAYFAD